MIRPALVLAFALVVASAAIGASAGNGRIDGRILFDDGSPVRRAVVALSGTPVGGGRVTLTDAEGRFTFPGLSAGQFTVSATKAPHLPTFYGSLRPARGPGRPIAVAADTSVSIAMTMPRGAVISGRVLDAQGRPQANALVSVLVARGAAGRLAPHSTVSTNDIGEYRAYGLPAGRYLVTAQSGFGFNGASVLTEDMIRWADREIMRRGAATNQAAAVPPPRGRTMNYASTLYPGVVDPAAATLVEVQAGEERGGIDIPLLMVPSTRLNGRVVGPDGGVPDDVRVGVIWPGHDLGLVDKSYLGNRPLNLGMSVQEGRFTRSALTPGRYVFVARASSRAPDEDDAEASLDLWAVQEVEINGELERDLIIQLRSGMSVSGTASYPGTSPPPRLLLTPVDGDFNLGVRPAAIDGDGVFTFTGVPPGNYALQLEGEDDAGLVIETAVSDDREVADGVLTVNDGVSLSGLSVTLGLRRTSISGRLLDRLGRPAPDCIIVAFSADRTHWRTGSRRIRRAQPGTDGRYSLMGLPAGDYLIAAVTSLEPDDLSDASFLELLARQAARVTVGKEAVTLDLQIAGG